MAQGRVSEIWRYPVSGLQGEKLTEASILRTGIAGDHVYTLRDPDGGKILDPISHSSSLGKEGLHGMLEFAATLSGDPDAEHEMTVQTAEKRTVYSSSRPDDTNALSHALGRPVEVIRYPRIVEARVRAGRTLHLLTDASLEQMKRAYAAGDFDARRFRPNLLMAVGDGLQGYVEEAWIGKDLFLGGQVRLRVEKANIRCKITTMRQAGIGEDAGILETIHRENSKNLGIMCSVLGEGQVRVGYPVSLV